LPLTFPPPIETARLLIRPVTERDLPDLWVVNGNDAVTRFLPYGSWRSLEDGKTWFRRMTGLQTDGSALQFVVVEKSLGQVIGSALLFRYEEASARIELGYTLGHDHWGHGYMVEALTALFRVVFGEMVMHRIEAQVNPQNGRSFRTLLRLGFRKEGLLRGRYLDKGQAVDVEMYGLLRSEWTR
jgi:RimJ/RimL family protein N-acetyltransferase